MANLILKGDQMADKVILNENDEKTIDIEHKDGLLEELNLPPNIIRFIRQNARNLQIAAAFVFILVISWAYYDYYTETKQNEAAAALNAAVQESDQALRLEMLKEVTESFSGTGAALWSRVEQAHIAVQAGNYELGISEYNDILDDIDSWNPLSPLITYNIGLAYENSGEQDKALKFYARLAAYSGFEVKGLMAQGRLQELKGDVSEALKSYHLAADNDSITATNKNILQEKISFLQNPESEEK
jgi:predicted negative regulator of RcsB-dependent stress response